MAGFRAALPPPPENGRFRTGGRERQGEAIPAETDPAVTVADVLGKHDGARVGEPAGSAKFT
jgi:hypothetical protein